MDANTIVKLIAGAVMALVLTIAGCNSLHTVKTGTVGVKTSFGKIVGTAIPAGLVFLNPFTENVENISIQTQKWNGETITYTKDVQQANIRFVLNYNLDPIAAADVYATVGVDWADKLVGQIVIENIKNVLGNYNAVPLVEQRADAISRIKDMIAPRLAAKNVIVTGFQITDISYNKEFEEAVEAKVVAQQDAIREQNKTVKIKELATQAVATATGEAEATLVKAKAEAESIKIRADALAQNAKLVEWEAVQKWNGTLPVWVAGGNATPFINITPPK